MRVLMWLTVLSACSDKGSESSAPATDDSASSGTVVEAVCTEPTEVGCVDEMILDLSLQDEVSEGEISSESDGDDTVTDVDATAGGYSAAPRNPWIYVKFTADGASKVEIDDEAALESMDWDMALKRYIIRLNSKDSGPSCVSSAAMFGFDYAELDSVPEGLVWQQDDFYSDSCGLAVDSIGGAQTAMAPWWEYSQCVGATGVPFFVQLADGNVLKLAVEKYYEDQDVQDECNETGSVPMGSEGGYIRLRWQMLD